MEELFDEFVMQALSHNASDLHFISKKEHTIYMRSKGCLKKLSTLPLNKYEQLTHYLLYLSEIDLNQPHKLQTGHFKKCFENHCYHFRLSYIPNFDSCYLDLRILNHHPNITLDEICVFEDVRKIFQKISNMKNGLILICGPTGSGKSTTMHALLREIDKEREKNIITIEDPIEITNDHFVQIQLNESQGLNFLTVFNQILRHDPDVIFLGEIRNKESAMLATRLALTGHLTLATMHASHCQAVIRRLLNLSVLEEDLKEVLRTVICQKLIYSNKQEKPIVLHEFFDSNHIRNYFNHKKIEYETFDSVLSKAVKYNYLTLEDIEGE